MNRAERRAKGIKGFEPIINIKASDIEQIKRDAVALAVEKAFFLMVAIPNMVIHDKFGDLMKREGREERFANHILDLYDTFMQGYVNIEDLQKCLKEETGLSIEALNEKRKKR